MILTGLPWRSYCTAFLWRQKQNDNRHLDWIRFILHEWKRLKIMNYAALQLQTAPSMSWFICLFASPTQLSYNQVAGAISIFKHVLQNTSKLIVVTVALPKPPKKEKISPSPNSPSSSEMPEWLAELYNTPWWSTNSASVRPREAEYPRGEGSPRAGCPRSSEAQTRRLPAWASLVVSGARAEGRTWISTETCHFLSACPEWRDHGTGKFVYIEEQFSCWQINECS